MVLSLQVIESSLKFGRQLDSDHIPLQVAGRAGAGRGEEGEKLTINL